MPVSPEAMAWRCKAHPVLTSRLSATRSWPARPPCSPFLGDIFVLPRPLPLANVFSIGDVLIGLGGALFILRTMHVRVLPTVFGQSAGAYRLASVEGRLVPDQPSQASVSTAVLEELCQAVAADAGAALYSMTARATRCGRLGRTRCGWRSGSWAVCDQRGDVAPSRRSLLLSIPGTAPGVVVLSPHGGRHGFTQQDRTVARLYLGRLADRRRRRRQASRPLRLDTSARGNPAHRRALDAPRLGDEVGARRSAPRCRRSSITTRRTSLYDDASEVLQRVAASAASGATVAALPTTGPGGEAIARALYGRRAGARIGPARTAARPPGQPIDLGCAPAVGKPGYRSDLPRGRR